MARQAKRVRASSGFGRAASLGMDLAVGMGVFAFGGYWLDQRRGGGVRWTLCGALLGFLYVGYEIWKVLRSLQQGEIDRTTKPPRTSRDGVSPEGSGDGASLP